MNPARLLVYFKWKTLPYFKKFLFSDVCSFFSVFVEPHISSLSKAAQRTKEVEGLRGVRVPPARASLVLNITNKDDNTAFFPTLEM